MRRVMRPAAIGVAVVAADPVGESAHALARDDVEGDRHVEVLDRLAEDASFTTELASTFTKHT